MNITDLESKIVASAKEMRIAQLAYHSTPRNSAYRPDRLVEARKITDVLYTLLREHDAELDRLKQEKILEDQKQLKMDI